MKSAHKQETVEEVQVCNEPQRLRKEEDPEDDQQDAKDEVHVLQHPGVLPDSDIAVVTVIGIVMQLLPAAILIAMIVFVIIAVMVIRNVFPKNNGSVFSWIIRIRICHLCVYRHDGLLSGRCGLQNSQYCFSSSNP